MGLKYQSTLTITHLLCLLDVTEQSTMGTVTKVSLSKENSSRKAFQQLCIASVICPLSIGMSGISDRGAMSTMQC